MSSMTDTSTCTCVLCTSIFDEFGVHPRSARSVRSRSLRASKYIHIQIYIYKYESIACSRSSTEKTLTLFHDYPGNSM